MTSISNAFPAAVPPDVSQKKSEADASLPASASAEPSTANPPGESWTAPTPNYRKILGDPHAASAAAHHKYKYPPADLTSDEMDQAEALIEDQLPDQIAALGVEDWGDINYYGPVGTGDHARTYLAHGYVKDNELWGGTYGKTWSCYVNLDTNKVTGGHVTKEKVFD